MTNNTILVGKKPKFLNLVQVKDASDINFFPTDVQKAIKIEGQQLRVDSREYAEGEVIPFGSYIAWEKDDHPRCPHGYNLWNKRNSKEQLSSGILEEVGGKFRQTKIVAFKAQLFSGEIPQIFKEMPSFDGQVKVKDGCLFIETPWGIADCKTGEGFAILYGICTEDPDIPEKFWDKLDGNILTIGTKSFEDYYHVTESGEIIETLQEYYSKL